MKFELSIKISLITLVLIVVALGYIALHRMPELEKRTDRLDTDLHGQLSGMTDQLTLLHADETAMEARTHEEVQAMGLTVAGLKMNVMLLCGQKRSLFKNCDAKALVADARGVSRIQAQFVSAAKVTLNPGTETPQVTSQKVKEQLPMYGWADRVDSHAYPADKASKPEFANMMLWSSAADSAHWHQEGNAVQADFANGAATFTLGDSVSKDEKQALVDSLNATVEVLQAGAVSSAPNKR